ncbi:MAG TPA: DUF6544 family protein [Ktedonobacteraceae bacterium]
MSSPSQGKFDPETLAERVPATALRYLTHAIRPGATIARRAEITFHGFVRLKPRLPWLSFRGRETIVAGRSFHVTARASLGPLLVTTRDRYEQGAATAQVRLFGLIPVMDRHGSDLARSARGRLVVESTWLPSSFLPDFGAHWSEEGNLPQLTMSIDNEDVRVTMRLESDGLLRELSLQRWSDLTDDGRYAWIPFASHTEAERTFGDYTVPSRLRASWWAGTDREFEFFRTEVDTIHYSP